MATVTTAVPGNLGLGATWVGGAIPGPGDDAVIAHNCTLPNGASLTVLSTTINNGITLTVNGGTLTTGNASDATAIALRTAGTGGTGVLALQSGATLVLRSRVLQGAATWTSTAGTANVVIEYDNASAGTWQISDANFQYPAFVFAGTAPFFTEVRSRSSGGRLQFTSGDVVGGGRLAGERVRLLRVGDGSQPMVNWWSWSNATDRFELRFFEVDDCGEIRSGLAVKPEGAFRLRDGVFRNRPAGAKNVNLGTGANLTARDATRFAIERVDFDGALETNSPHLTMTDVSFYIVNQAGDPSAYDPISSASAAQNWSVDRMISWSAFGATGGPMPAGSWSNLYLVNEGGLNPRWFNFLSTGGYIIDKFFIQRFGGDSVGDPFVLSANPATPTSYALRFGNFLPDGAPANPADRSLSCKTWSPLGNLSNARFSMEHCTFHVRGGTVESAAQFGESQTANIGAICESFRGNLAWAQDTSGLRYLINRIGTFNQQDLILAENATHNGGWNLSAQPYFGSNGVPLCTGTPGANDVRGNPDFVNPWRDIASHYVAVAGTSTGTRTGDGRAWMEELRKRNTFGATYDPAFNFDALAAHVDAGFSPQNLAFQAAHDTEAGGWIGAVEGIAPPPPVLSGQVLFHLREAARFAGLIP